MSSGFEPRGRINNIFLRGSFRSNNSRLATLFTFIACLCGNVCPHCACMPHYKIPLTFHLAHDPHYKFVHSRRRNLEASTVSTGCTASTEDGTEKFIHAENITSNVRAVTTRPHKIITAKCPHTFKHILCGSYVHPSLYFRYLSLHPRCAYDVIFGSQHFHNLNIYISN
jgi:hypothetical protein